MSSRRRWMLGTAALAAALQARAQAPGAGADRRVHLEDFTWTELRDAVRGGSTTALVPVGGTEQSGPAIALGKHNLRARRLAGLIAVALGDAIVAPVVAYVPEGQIDPATSHMRFAGTLSIPDDAFEKTLEWTARSLRLHGFVDIVFLGDHGGYRTQLDRVAQRLGREWASAPVRVHALREYFEASTEGFAALLRARGYRDDEIGTHAALADASLTLAIAAEAVRPDRLASNPPPGPSQGVYGGDPRRASAELGRLGVDLIVQRSVEAIRRRRAHSNA